MRHSTITPNFHMPEDYRRTFLFRVEGSGFTYRIDALGGPPRFEIREQGTFPPAARSLCLDWIQESMETVRLEVGADK